MTLLSRDPTTRAVPGGRARAAALAARVGPTSSRRDRLLPLLAPLVPLFPGGGLLRGTVVGVEASHGPGGSRSGSRGAGGATTLALSLLAEASATGSWCAAVGIADPGVTSLAELGTDLDRLAVVPLPSATWPEVAATLLEGMDIVLVRLPWPANAQVGRRLVSRARASRAVLIVLGPSGWWPGGHDVRLAVRAGRWHGVGHGHGHLEGRLAEVTASGRGVATRQVSSVMWLPAAGGSLATDDVDE
jgi:hypothetical protein